MLLGDGCQCAPSSGSHSRDTRYSIFIFCPIDPEVQTGCKCTTTGTRDQDNRGRFAFLDCGQPRAQKKKGRKKERKKKERERERERRVGPAVPSLGNINRSVDGNTDPRPLEARRSRRLGWVG